MERDRGGWKKVRMETTFEDDEYKYQMQKMINCLNESAEASAEVVKHLDNLSENIKELKGVFGDSVQYN